MVIEYIVLDLLIRLMNSIWHIIRKFAIWESKLT